MEDHIEEGRERGRMSVKTYVVLQRVSFPKDGKPNAKIVDVKLTHSAAQALVDRVPGTWIEKYLATK